MGRSQSSAPGGPARIPRTSVAALHSTPVVEILFMMVVLKLPVIYLAVVVYWAVKAEPRPYEAALLPVSEDPGPQRWHPRRPSRNGPHGSPQRREARRTTVSRARA
jgi:hypothetical protein